MAKNNKRPAVPSEEEENPAQSLDAVRDLLFGAASREFSDSVSSLADETAEQLRELERNAQSAIDELRAEQNASLTLAKKHSAEQLSDTEADLTSLLQSTVTAMRNEFQSRLRNLEQRFESEVVARREETVSRTAFVEVMRTALDQIENHSTDSGSVAPENRAKAS